MRSLSRVATLAGTGVLALGAALAFANVAVVRAAGQVASPDTVCNKTTPCLVKTNHGNGAGIEGVSLGSGSGSASSAAIVGRANGLNGVFGFSTGQSAGIFENDNTTYISLVAGTAVSGGSRSQRRQTAALSMLITRATASLQEALTQLGSITTSAHAPAVRSAPSLRRQRAQPSKIPGRPG